MANQMIALGVNPPQPVNMLKSATDVATLGALMQDVQGARGVQEAIAGGMAPTDPRLLQYGKRGQAAYSAALEGRAAELDMAGKKADLIGSAANFVLNNPTPENFNSAVSNLVRLGVYTPEEGQEALAEVQADPSRIRLIAEQQARQALSVKDQLMQMYSQDVGGAVQVMGVDPLTGRPRVLSRTGKSLTPGQRLEQQRMAQAEQQQAQVNALLMGQGAGAPANALTAPSASAAGAASTAPEAPTTGVSPEEQLRGQIRQLRLLAAQGNPQAAAAADQLEQLVPSQQNVPVSIQEYNLAVGQGYTGTFEQFRKQKAPMFEPEYAKVVGKTAAERDNQQFTTAGEAASNLPKIYDTLDQLETSDAITGFGADILKNVERFRAQFMADEKAGKRVADTEILDALLGSDVFPMIGALGIGARGLDTPAEREFLRQVMTGTISMDKDALIRLTEIRKNVAERAIDRYNQRVEKGEFDRFFDVQGIEPQKIEKPVRPSVETRNQAAASDTPPPNLDPEIARLWQFMTPEDRMLWLK